VDYEVDTEPGSSGSPVFNNRWELVALHSRAGKGQFNQGVAVTAIVDDLPEPLAELCVAEVSERRPLPSLESPARPERVRPGAGKESPGRWTMSPSIFDTLANKWPDLRQAWPSLRGWFELHPHIKFVDVRQLARELPKVPDQELALALTAMAKLGVLRSVYRYVAPGGVLLDEEFDSPEQVPDKLPDRFHTQYFDTSEGDIIPGYRVESNGADPR
jgi:hypothetical protein